MTSSLQNLTSLFANLQEGTTLEVLNQHLAAGVEPQALLEALNGGMEIVGEKYAQKEYFLVELIMAAEIFKQAMEILEPHMGPESGKSREIIGTLVIGTVQGDLHDIGKNIFVGLSRNAGFQVLDLGVDVSPQTFIEKVRDHEA